MIQLTHRRTTELHRTGIVGALSTNTFDEFFDAVKQYAANHFPPDLSNEDNPNEKANDFKGAVFEVFGEFFLKYFSKDRYIGVIDYMPNFEKDLGVDGTGKSFDHLPLTVQFKFRSNPYSMLTYRALGTYFTDSVFRFGVTADQQRNLLVLTTAKDVSYNIKEVVPGCRFITYDDFKSYTDGNVDFWAEFKLSVKNSAKKAKKRQVKQLYEHQVNTRQITITDLLTSTSLHRAQVIMATGGGKTTNEHLAVEDSITHCKTRLHVVVAPRIALSAQLFSEFWDQKVNNWHPILVNSSGEEQELEAYVGDDDTFIKPTINKTDIDNQIRDCLNNNIPVVVFITYHSALIHFQRLCNEFGIDLAVCDEGHNLTRKGWFELLKLPIKKWIFYTATRKINYSKNSGDTVIGRGMNNTKMFGNPIVTLSPRYLMDRGMIVPPRLHLVHIPSEDVDKFNMRGIDKHALKEQMVAVIAGIKEHVNQVKQYGDDSARVIVFCEGAGDAHDFAESNTLKTELPDFYIDAVTSYKNRMKRPRKEIFENFKREKFSILFHFDVLSEGIDLPGATAILVLRPLKEIKATQGVGRTLRALLADRFDLSVGKIEVGDPAGWRKPYGWVILPIIEGKNEDAMLKIEQIVRELRSRDYDIDVEKIKVSSKGKKREPKKDELKPALPEQLTVADLDKLIGKNIQEIIDSVDHEIEEEFGLLVNAEVKPDDYGIEDCFA